ncbi:MAG: zinc ribbon domain-containing protein [Planctomycetota bacterium]
MPIYEYACGACKHEFEELASSITAPDKPRCPECGSPTVARKLSIFAARGGLRAATAPRSSPCGRCGDPDGPCSL